MTTGYSKIKSQDTRSDIQKTIADAVRDFKERDPRMVDVPCPFCTGVEAEPRFSVYGYDYKGCARCGSLYLSPRLEAPALGEFYEFVGGRMTRQGAPASHAKERIELIIKPRWELLKAKLAEHGVAFPVARALEAGPGIGLFASVAQEGGCADEYVLVEPNAANVEALSAVGGGNVVNTLLEDAPAELDGTCDVVFINSVLEHPFDLSVFFAKVQALLRPGGLVCLVDMHSGGLDIEVLGGGADNVKPHFILQVGSIDGIEALAERSGLRLDETFSTGTMDADILYEFAKTEGCDTMLAGFAKILERPEVRRDLQEVLRAHKLTGYNGYILKKEGK